MKTYILPLKQKSGLLTELQSDTIYGHFCWRLKEQLGDEKLTEFISLYKSNKPVFLLSDGLLKVKDEIHFPRPFIFQKVEQQEKKVDKIIEFVERKRDKERKYLKLSELKNFLATGKIELEEPEEKEGDIKLKKKKIIEEGLRVSVQIDRNSLASAEEKLYSYNPKFTREDVSFVILVKVLDEDNFGKDKFNCEKILKDTFEIGFGKKKSSGYGQFEAGEMSEFNDLQEPTDSNAFIVLGNYLPDDSEKMNPIGYDINTKFGKLGEELSNSENPFKNPIVFLTAGSCFQTSIKKDFYGRVTDKGEVAPSKEFVIQFGIPFTLKFNYTSS